MTRPWQVVGLAIAAGCKTPGLGPPGATTTPKPTDTADTGGGGQYQFPYDCNYERTESLEPQGTVFAIDDVKAAIAAMPVQEATWYDGTTTAWTIRLDPDSLPAEVETVRYTPHLVDPYSDYTLLCPTRVLWRLPFQGHDVQHGRRHDRADQHAACGALHR